MKYLKILLILFSINTFSQGMTPEELADHLNPLVGSWGIGNACGVDNYMEFTIPGDWDMQENRLEILHAHITVEGNLVNEGPITFLCDTAILTILGETLSTPTEPEIYEFKVYPNPATTFVNINGDGIKQIIFYNLNGQKVKNFITPTRNNRIDISNLSSGMYLIHITDINNNLTTKKLIKR